MGLKDVRVLRYERAGPDVELMVEQVLGEVRCPSCQGRAQVKERPVVHYVDLPVYGTADVAGLEEAPDALCDPTCPTKSWVLTDHRIAAKGCRLTTQGGQVGHRPSRRGPDRLRGGAELTATGTRSTTPWSPMARPCSRPTASD